MAPPPPKKNAELENKFGVCGFFPSPSLLFHIVGSLFNLVIIVQFISI